MLLIHVPIITNRLKYIFSFILRDILRTEFDLTTDQRKYISYEGPKFCYGKKPIQDTLHFASVDLLFENDIYQQNIKFINWKDHKIFFPVNEESILPFDVFAASFYLVSGYAEYLPHTKDRHARFNAQDGLNFKAGFLDRPIINVWSDYLRILLTQKLNVEFSSRPYAFIPTIDISHAYAYKYKGAARNTLAFLDYLANFQFKKISRRFKVITGMVKDPHDTYEELNNIHKKYNIKPLYFISVGNPSKYNRNLSHTNKHYISLIQELDKTGEVCLLASYKSADNEGKLLNEKQRLEKILGRPVTKSRQHYLKINIPQTYRMLVNIGIREDYSMGYASAVGLRPGTSSPYYFFDIIRDEQTNLKVFPITVMDTTMKHSLRIRSQDVISYLSTIVDEIKSVGGNFIFIFHNESIGNSGRWKNWGNIYEKVIKLAITKKD
jgi:hypothetical protein